MSGSFHAATRAQQRGIPPFVANLLDNYGHREFDGHGGVSSTSTRLAEGTWSATWGANQSVSSTNGSIPTWSLAAKMAMRSPLVADANESGGHSDAKRTHPTRG